MADVADDLPKSLMEAVLYFTRERCADYMVGVKWPDRKIKCPACGNESCKPLRTRPVIKCNRKVCQKQTSLKVGTIFEDSKLTLDKWFVAIWVVANSKNGISSHELARAIKVRQPTAWFMEHRIREAMKSGNFTKLMGPVESDETFIGGESRNMHEHKRQAKIKGRGSVGKQAVQGILQRGGEVRTFARNVEIGEWVYTDSASGYAGLAARYLHATVDHAKEYVRGKVHTNGLENFWSLFKRCVKGTWTHTAPLHVERYADEEAWRFNNRKTHDGIRFQTLMSGVVGKRLTYRRLCAIGDSGFMGTP